MRCMLTPRLNLGPQALPAIGRCYPEGLPPSPYDRYRWWWLRPCSYSPVCSTLHNLADCSSSDCIATPQSHPPILLYHMLILILLLHRSFLKRPGDPNIPIQAIGLSLYEDLGRGDAEEVPGTKVTRTQWLDLSSLEMANLIGKNILIVDEVDDTRTTLEYAVRELEKDVEIAQKQLGREGEKTNFFVFVLHVSIPYTIHHWDRMGSAFGKKIC